MHSSKSAMRAGTVSVVHLSFLLYTALADFSSFGSETQWLLLSLISYSIAVDWLRTNATIQESRGLIKSAHEAFQKALSGMCDAYFILDGEGFILGMDRWSQSSRFPRGGFSQNSQK